MKGNVIDLASRRPPALEANRREGHCRRLGQGCPSLGPCICGCSKCKAAWSRRESSHAKAQREATKEVLKQGVQHLSAEPKEFSTRVMPAQKPHRSEQTVGTPWSLIYAVEKRWGGLKMDFDLAALPSNAKAKQFFTPNDDALTRAWSKIEGLPKKDARLWLNPPYSNIAPWAGKCALFSKTTFCKLTGARLFFLVPASVGSNWWAEYVHKRAAVYFIRPRVVFQTHSNPYPKDLALCVFGDKPDYFTWDLKNALDVR